MTSKPLVRRTLATLRRAEFGFFGVVVYTRVQTPRFCGFCSIAGTLDLAFCGSRPLRISWLIVGMKPSPFIAGHKPAVTLPSLRSHAKSAKPGRTNRPPGHRVVEQCSARPAGATESRDPPDEGANSLKQVKGQRLGPPSPCERTVGRRSPPPRPPTAVDDQT